MCEREREEEDENASELLYQCKIGNNHRHILFIF